MLNEEGCKPSEIQVLIVNRGPGSYTGLRVGLMSAKAFAYATGCALLAVDGFAAIARQSPADVIDVIADAQRCLVYQQRFTRSAESQEVVPVTALQIVELSTWIQSLATDGWVSGPGLRKFSDRMPGHIRIPDESLWDPHAQSILEIGLSRYRAGERDDQWTLEPLYLRPSSAEEKWAGKDQ
jgi:tRNA threonylcarbamoyladenosine biosynthesis protein TsaB